MTARVSLVPRVRRRPGRVLGLTLIELMIVVAVVAVIAALAAPSLGDMFARNHVSGAGSEVFADMQFARAESVQRNTAVTMTFAAGGYQVAAGATVLKSVTFADGTNLSSGAGAVVTFEPVRGTAAWTGGPTVTVAHPRTSRTLRLGINLLGRPEVCAPSGGLSGYATC